MAARRKKASRPPGLPEPGRTRWQEPAVVLFFVLASIVWTWPLLAQAKSFTADMGFDDPILFARIMRNNVEWLLRMRPGGLFDGDFFFPHPLSLTTTDPSLGVALIALPFRLFTDDYFVLVNLAIVASFALTAHATYLLARDLTGSRAPGVFAGMVFAFCNYRFHHLDHAHVLQMQWLVYSLVFLHRLQRAPGWRNALGAWVFLYLNGISSANVAIYSTLVYPVVAVWLVWTCRPELKRAFLLRLGAAAGLALLALAPFYATYLSTYDAYGIKRDLSQGIAFSARIEQLASATHDSLLYQGWSGSLGHESVVFLGFTVIALAAFALVRAVRAAPERAMVFLYLVLAALYLAISFGPEVTFRGKTLFPGPWALLAGLPGFSAIRTPSRFFMVTELGFAILAAYGLRGLSARRVLVGLSFLGVTLETWVAPIHMRRVPTLADAPPVYYWLADQPGRGPILELPLRSAAERARMLWGNIHKRPTVDAESSFPVPVLDWIHPRSVRSGRLPWALRRLRAAGLKYIVLHERELPPADVPTYLAALDDAGARFVITLGPIPDHVYALDDPPAPRPFTRENVDATLERGSVVLATRDDHPVYEPKLRRLTLEAWRGGALVGRTKIPFAPPLLAPGEPDTLEVRLSGSGDSLNLVDERGRLWAEAHPRP